jgi:hypothetical protein
MGQKSGEQSYLSRRGTKFSESSKQSCITEFRGKRDVNVHHRWMEKFFN